MGYELPSPRRYDNSREFRIGAAATVVVGTGEMMVWVIAVVAIVLMTIGMGSSSIWEMQAAEKRSQEGLGE